LLTVLERRFVTHTLAPSKAMPMGSMPTANEPRIAPSFARSLVTLFELEFVTHTLAPSKAIAYGAPPTVNVPRTTPSLLAVNRIPRLNADGQRGVPVIANAWKPTPVRVPGVNGPPFRLAVAPVSLEGAEGAHLRRTGRASGSRAGGTCSVACVCVLFLDWNLAW
jgi:hypothetical protein